MMRIYITALCALLLGMLLPVSPAFAGWDRGNAGDAFAAEFRLTGRDLVQRLELLYQNNKRAFDTGPLRSAVEQTNVVSEERVDLNGNEPDAKNYPDDKLIVLNRTRWRELRRPTETKARLRVVLHEYLWISGVDDTNFSHSDRLIQLLQVKDYSPNKWWNPVNPVNYVEPALSVAPSGCSMPAGHLDLKSTAETLELEAQGSCGNDYRKLRLVKTAGVTPVSSNVRGMFHTFALTVFDRAGAVKGEVTFEPEWGECLLPEDGSCRTSGKLTLGGVEVVFWFLRE